MAKRVELSTFFVILILKILIVQTVLLIVSSAAQPAVFLVFSYLVS